MNQATQLDARHLLCPMPVIRTQTAMDKLQDGALLQVTATDPGVLHDIPAWCRVHGHTVQRVWQEGRDIHLLLQVGQPSGTK